MITKFISTSILFLSLLPQSALAQRREAPKQEVKAIALGARRVAKFIRSTKEYKIKMEGPDGGEIEETIPKGVPIEIAGKENEYVPYQLYAKNRGAKSKVSRFSLGLNTFSPNVKLTPKESLTLYKRRAIPVDGGETKYKLESYASTAGNIEASHLLVALVKNFKELEGWAKPMIRVFDVSPAHFSKNSCLIFNSSPFEMLIKFSDREKISLRPYAHTYARNLKKDKYGAIPYSILLKVGNKTEKLPSGGLSGGSNSRHYIFTFVDPRKGITRRGDIAVFSEQVPKIVAPPNRNGALPAEASSVNP